MPPIPIYSSSPINPSKASGVTPKTAESQENNPQVPSGPTPTTKQAYTPAQPGATPFLPVQTGTAQASSSPPQPTRTQQQEGPPPPQPGAAPTASKSLPPPPKTGESYHPPEPTPAPTMPMPPQMSYSPPSSAYTPYQGTTTTQPNTARPVMLGGAGDADLSHPPGYQQNTAADQFTSQQRHQASMAEGRTYDGEDDGVWDQAKKWATGVGDSLAAAESEVWKRINKQ